MAVSLYSFVDMYTRAIAVAAHVLEKGAAHAKEQGMAEDEILEWRLIDDMHPLRFQLAIVIDFTRHWLARAAGLELPPEFVSEGKTVADFQAALADARAWVSALTPEQFEGRDDAPLKVSLGGGAMEPELPVSQWITGFATVNVYFHLSTAYGILRKEGVPIGKLDLFPMGL